MGTEFEGTIGRTMAASRGWWPPLPQPPEGAPNIMMVVLDDVGYAQLGCYGSDIATPTFDRLASQGRRYANFHTTALCSPTRACLLTGRNHHSSGMARVVELASGFPGYNATIPPENGFLSEILRGEGYATFAVGKWHLSPATEMAAGSPRTRWPLGRGFDRYYGFLGGETDQYHPELWSDGAPVEPPRSPEEGYHLTEDLVDHAIRFIADLRGSSPTTPYFLWFAPGACHAPHQAPAEYIDAYRGQFDAGWEAWREAVFARQLSSGLLPPGTDLSERPSWVPPWDSLTDDERTVAARLMEAFAGYLTHTDAEVGRLLEFIDQLGETDDTLVVVVSDNGASAEGGATGSFNEQCFFNFVPEDVSETLARLDDLGSPRANNHYPWGWAWAGNTPLKRFKRDTHEGGVADPLIVSWPRRLGTDGGTRHQYTHAIDVLPTVLDLLGIEPPATIAGVEQTPIEGVSFAPTLTDAEAPSAHRTQYYEMLGSRGIYHDGWKAVAFHTPAFIDYEGAPRPASFDEDRWELYHVAEDFSEVHDLAAVHPEKLDAMVALWWQEAERYQVLPLNDEPGMWGDPRHRRPRHEFVGQVGPLAEASAPNLKNREWTITADLAPAAGGGRPGATGVPDGVLVAHGGHAGGYALLVHDGRLRFTYNFVALTITTVVADVPLPADGPVTVSVDFRRTGLGGELTLRQAGEVVGTGTIPVTTPLTYGTPGFTVGFQPAGPIDPEVRGRAEVPPTVLRRVVVDCRGVDPIRDSMIDPRVDLATQ